MSERSKTKVNFKAVAAMVILLGIGFIGGAMWCLFYIQSSLGPNYDHNPENNVSTAEAMKNLEKL